MASPEFSKSMTAQELCAYLEEVGMEESDLKTIHGEYRLGQVHKVQHCCMQHCCMQHCMVRNYSRLWEQGVESLQRL